AGTLRIRSPRWEDGSARLEFVFYPSPPAEFGPSQGLMKAAGPRGRSSRIIPGVDFNSIPNLVFPAERDELEAMTKGLRHDAVVPVSPMTPPGVGDNVTFVEATADPFGTPIFVPRGDSLSVKLTKVRDENYQWVGQRLYYIAWDPGEVIQQSAQVPAP